MANFIIKIVVINNSVLCLILRYNIKSIDKRIDLKMICCFHDLKCTLVVFPKMKAACNIYAYFINVYEKLKLKIFFIEISIHCV